MNEQQVVVASHRAAVPAAFDSGACTMLPGKGKPRLQMPYRSGDLNFTAIFCFDDSGRLCTVDLKADSKDEIDVTTALRNKYGKPVREEPSDEDSALVEWSAGKDAVRYSRFLNDAHIIYVPRNGGNASGL